MTASTNDAPDVLRRVALASLAAPLAVLPLILVFVLCVVPPFGQSLEIGFVDALMLYSVFGLLYAYPATWIVGIPVYFLLRRAGWQGYPVFFAAGAMLAAVGWFVLIGIPVGSGLFETLFPLLFVLCGGAVAVAFRAIAGIGDATGVALH